jgi:molybdenum cofactor cytidylyltransferase
MLPCMVSALLLAAGESRRMGKFKQLLPFKGKTFVECCVDNLLASGAGEVLIVTGHRETDVRSAVAGRAVAGRAVRFVHNPDYPLGMSSSIKCGLQALSPTAEALMIALVDQPQIGPSIINQVVEAFLKTRAPIVIPRFAGRGGHPVLLDLSLKDEILAMDPATGLKQVVHAHAGEVLHVDVASRAILIDFDYPEDISESE